MINFHTKIISLRKLILGYRIAVQNISKPGGINIMNFTRVSTTTVNIRWFTRVHIGVSGTNVIRHVLNEFT